MLRCGARHPGGCPAAVALLGMVQEGQGWGGVGKSRTTAQLRPLGPLFPAAQHCTIPAPLLSPVSPPAQVFNLGNPGAVYKSLQSPLKYQTRCISCFPDKVGRSAWAVRGPHEAVPTTAAWLPCKLPSGLMSVPHSPRGACSTLLCVSPGATLPALSKPPRLQPAHLSQTGYLVASIEGRVAVHHVEDNLQSKNFTFKCHRWVGLRRTLCRLGGSGLQEHACLLNLCGQAGQRRPAGARRPHGTPGLHRPSRFSPHRSNATAQGRQRRVLSQLHELPPPVWHLCHRRLRRWVHRPRWPARRTCLRSEHQSGLLCLRSW